MTTPAVVNPSGSPPASGAVASSQTVTGVSPPASEFRFAAGPEVPAWAVGKTAQEILQVSKQMADALATAPAPRSTVPPVPSTPPPPPAATMPSDDDWVTNPAKATQQVLEYNYGQRVQPVIERLLAQQAGTARGLAAQQFADEFRRWGPEIDQLVASIPAEQRPFELYQNAVKVVRANHVDEIASERVQQRLAEMGVTDRTSGGGTVASVAGSTVDLSKISPAYKATIDAMGITESQLREFLTATGQTMEQFVESANKNQVISDVQWQPSKGKSTMAVGEDKLGVKVRW